MKALSKETFLSDWVTPSLPDNKWEKEYKRAKGELEALIEYGVDEYKEFVNWVLWDNHPFMWFTNIDKDGREVRYFTDEISNTKWSLDDLYEYWKGGSWK